MRTLFVCRKMALSAFVARRGATLIASRSSAAVRWFSSPDKPLKLEPFVDFEQFEAYRKGGKAFIVDVREPEELVTDGEIPKAVNIPMGMLEQAFVMDSSLFKDTFHVDKPKPSDPVIFLCLKGIRAKTASDFVQEQYKYENTSVYTGSFADWIERKQPSK